MFPAFTLFEQELYSYPLVMGMAWAVAFQLTDHLNKLHFNALKNVKLFFLLVFIMSWLGAKLFFLLTIQTSNLQIIQLAEKSTFWFGGGFVFYGGMIFGLIATIIFFRYKNISIDKMNLLIPGLSLGHGMGRLGCFMAGCCYGKQTEFFLSINMHGHNRHPVQLYESLMLMVLSTLFYFKLKNPLSDKSEIRHLWPNYLVAYGIIRFIMEMLRGDLIRGFGPGGLSTSQLISLAIIIVAVLFKIYRKRIL